VTTSKQAEELYARAGITDVAEYYRSRFFTDSVWDARYFDALNRFDIRYARTMWVYDNIRPGAQVLELGCGEGMLALLKLKDAHLTGVDLSMELLTVARRNGYDVTCKAHVAQLPFPDDSFDYVVSLDVLGHIAADEKDTVIAEMARVLRPGGVTLHGIEMLNRELHKGYETMSAEALKSFLSIDGHIGLEDEEATAARFHNFFAHVEARPRYTLCLSADEFLKQADEYGVPFETDFLNYLRGLSFDEKRAFNLAMGYVFGKVSDLDINLPSSGLYLLLKASPAPLGPFYAEHRERRALLRADDETNSAGALCLDRSGRARFERGWYEANDLPPVARWMGAYSRTCFRASSLLMLRLDLTTHMPDLDRQPIELEFTLNGVRLCVFALCRYGWLELQMEVPQEFERSASPDDGWFELEIRATRTWQPSVSNPGNTDDRQLSIAVCNIEIAPQT
jgi:ubiquinone/menaquinone biosynthesis C-methylase UbiE